MKRAWLLNLDADDELADPEHRTSQSMRGRIQSIVPKLSLLIPDGDVVLDGKIRADGLRGMCWCPTPHAMEDLERAGAAPAPHPPFDVVRRVNDRAFHCEVFGKRFGGRYAKSHEELMALLSEMDRPVALKRAHSFAGRGLLVVTNEVLDKKEHAWVVAAFKLGGVYLEPWRRKVEELGVHGFARDGGSAFGEPTRQIVHSRGAWRATERAEVDAAARETLRTLQIQAAAALVAAGYFGPFGVDVLRTDDGALVPCEINARYTMGWAIGMGDRRPDLD